MKETAKAAVFAGAHQAFIIKEFEVLPAPKGYGRSRLIASGVCGTDLHFMRGTLEAGIGSIVGHEFVGKLEDCDEEEAAAFGLKKGDNVIADIAVPCGHCLLCEEGDDANCVNMDVTNGNMAEEAPYFWGGYGEVNFTPLTNLVKIPDMLDPVAVATFACPGPTVLHSVALAKKANIDVSAANVAVVQGTGPVGCFAVMYLKAVGVKKVYVITGGRNADKDKIARLCGADEIFNLALLGEKTVTEILQKENGGLGVDLVIECSGAPAAVKQGMEILRNRGVYLIPGQYSAGGTVAIQPEMITFKALQILGSSQYAMEDVHGYLDFLCAHPESQQIIRKLGTAYPVSEVNRAFADAMQGKNIKTLLTAEK